mmetsp:Transcript_29374/g.83608  ORF Transcript_29374/g.83608 Transcript_29374/m.83608 type:complete len:566 (-) Transcript_29374:1187-2884(-)
MPCEKSRRSGLPAAAEDLVVHVPDVFDELRSCWPILRFPGHALLVELYQSLGHLCWQLQALAAGHPQHNLRRRKPRKRALRGDHLVQYHAEGIHVGLRCQATTVDVADEQLGRHVRNRAHGLRHDLLRLLVTNSSSAEVADLTDIALAGGLALQHDVVRREVAVDDPPLVQVVDGGGDLQRDLENLEDARAFHLGFRTVLAQSASVAPFLHDPHLQLVRVLGGPGHGGHDGLLVVLVLVVVATRLPQAVLVGLDEVRVRDQRRELGLHIRGKSELLVGGGQAADHLHSNRGAVPQAEIHLSEGALAGHPEDAHILVRRRRRPVRRFHLVRLHGAICLCPLLEVAELQALALVRREHGVCRDLQGGSCGQGDLDARLGCLSAADARRRGRDRRGFHAGLLRHEDAEVEQTRGEALRSDGVPHGGGLHGRADRRCGDVQGLVRGREAAEDGHGSTVARRQGSADREHRRVQPVLSRRLEDRIHCLAQLAELVGLGALQLEVVPQGGRGRGPRLRALGVRALVDDLDDAWEARGRTDPQACHRGPCLIPVEDDPIFGVGARPDEHEQL